MNKEHLKGIIGEIITIIHLFFRGYRLLKWRYKSKFGEIDLVLRKKETITFCEVKTRLGMKINLNTVENIVSHTQIRRIQNSAKNFMQQKRYKNFDMQVKIFVVNKIFGKIFIFPLDL